VFIVVMLGIFCTSLLSTIRLCHVCWHFSPVITRKVSRRRLVGPSPTSLQAIKIRSRFVVFSIEFHMP
jgi:hypothetical protein